ncbi:MAG: integrase core domain-containing protein, partial [Planctomycetota bacterium]
LTEARVVLEDWRWKYNHVRPHRSLGYVTPRAFAQAEATQNASVPGRGSTRPTASLRPSLELLYHLDQLIHPARLTQVLGQIE